eukprot:Blabericola_migrator_1__6411@NODE_3232_length_1928_cov_93_009672_g2024_i0_p2_GENE_NODE_3232_length_1928_cov_93_009672_g2024_i0NODE_3232_length_1928_cov_93_009672_g2024_i0_p2_ORF_typecomplete_len118_score12_63_NODE_3232_length_1928_cov_93_009672_g2024_i095448
MLWVTHRNRFLRQTTQTRTLSAQLQIKATSTHILKHLQRVGEQKNNRVVHSRRNQLLMASNPVQQSKHFHLRPRNSLTPHSVCLLRQWRVEKMETKGTVKADDGDITLPARHPLRTA